MAIRSEHQVLGFYIPVIYSSLMAVVQGVEQVCDQLYDLIDGKPAFLAQNLLQ